MRITAAVVDVQIGYTLRILWLGEEMRIKKKHGV